MATVVGGGPAGLMAAEVLAAAGMRVTVFEHMASVGRKLLLAGRGGLNLTHTEPLDDLVARYGSGADPIVAAVRAFDPGQLRAWCAGLGEPTVVGSSGRVFPRSFRATPLLRAWLRRLDDLGVTIETRARWLGWAPVEGRGRPDDRGSGPSTAPVGVDPRRSRFGRADGSVHEVVSDVTVFGLGGASWPRVGSDGGWVVPFDGAGVRVVPLRPANCGVVVGWTDGFVDRFAGAAVKDVAIEVDGVRARVDVVVTDDGLEGGPVYARSATIRDTVASQGRCEVRVDLRPDLDVDRLVDRLARRRPKDSVSTSLRRTLGLSPVAIGLVREATANRVPTDVVELAALLKAVPLVVERTAGIERAISSAGGIALDQIDASFMVRSLPGTFVAGEMLDWEAPTGGYLLQATFATAVAAAEGAIRWVEDGRGGDHPGGHPACEGGAP